MLHYSGDRAAVKMAVLNGAEFFQNNAIRNLKEMPNDDGTVTLCAKAIDRFQFVTHPKVTINPSTQSIVSCSCDCRKRYAGLCAHVVALLLSIGEEVDISPAVPQQFSPIEVPSPSQDEITIRLIREGVDVPGAGKPQEETSTAQDGQPLPRPVQDSEQESAFTPPGLRVVLGNLKSNDAPVVWAPNDTEQLLHPNMGVIGTMGTGKTQFTKSLIYQLVRDRGSNFGGSRPGILIFDYKGDYNETKVDFVNSVSARILKPYRLPTNPLALVEPRTFKPLLPTHTANAFKDTLSKIYHLGPKQQQFLQDCIRKAYEARGIRSEDPGTWKRRPPTLANVYEIYSRELGDRTPDSLTAALNKLHEFKIFDDSPLFAGSIRDLMNGVVVIDLSGYDPDIQSLVVAILLDQFYAQMMSLGSSKTDGRYRELRQLILVDEADNFMKENFPSLRKILKEGREFGVGTVLSTQSLSHFIGGTDDYSRYILTWVVHAASDLKQKDVEYIFKLPSKSPNTTAIYTAVKSLEKHQSVIKLSNRAPDAIQDLPFWKLIKQDE